MWGTMRARFARLAVDLRLRQAVVACLTVLVLAGIPGAKLHTLSHALPLGAPILPRGDDASARIEASVRAAGAGPLGGARVQVFAIVDGVAYLAGAATTDAGGHATIAELPRGEVWIIADVAGRARATSHVVLSEGPRAVDLELAEEHRLEVTVRDEHGAPVDGAEIEIVGGADPLAVGGRTGGDGVANVGRLGGAPWVVTARAVGYEEVAQRGVREGDKLVVTLRRLGALVVRVVDRDDSLVEGAHVQITGATLWPARVADTTKDGSVRIGALGAGSYALRATHDGDVSAIELGVMLARGEEKTITLRLVPGRWIAVRVMDGEGDEARPIGSARVSLAEGGISPFPLEARTDKEGRARLGPIGPGSATIAARADGFVPRGAVRVPEKDTGALVIPLVRAGVLVGRVVDTRGFPIDGATIEIIGTDFYGAPIADDPRRTSFREAHFEAMLPGPSRLVQAGELGVMPGPVPPIPHAFTVSQNGAPTGASGAPRNAGSTDTDEPWVTRNDGTFRAAPASPGRIRALVRHPQYVEAVSDAVTLVTGGEANVDVVMHAGGWLDGRVVDVTGHTVPGVRVQIAATRGSLERSTRTATDGTFAFAAVPDSVVVSVFRDDDSMQAVVRELVKIPEREKKSITLTLPEARPALAAFVKDDRGYSLDAVQITAHSLDPAAPLRVTAFTDERGEARLAGAKGLPLRVEVSASGYAPKILTTEPALDKLDVALRLAERATGEVRSSRGDPLADADVVLYTELGARRARTDAAGTYSVTGLAPGPAKLRVRAAGHAPATRDVKIPDSGGARPFPLPRIELGGEGIVEGVVVDARGDPVQGARVAKDRVPTYLAVGAAPAGVAVTDARGRFKLAELPEGDLTLEAYAADVGRTRVAGVHVAAGRTTIDVRITIEKLDKAIDPSASGGVAVTLGETSEPREVVLVAVAEGSEAERAGLAPNDVILEVDGVHVKTIDDARAKLNGPIADDVVIKLRRGERTETVRVGREQVRR